MNRQVEEQDQAEYLNKIISKPIGISSKQRLMRDAQEYHRRKNEIPNIAAAPLPDNMFKWHVNMAGAPGTRWEGGVYHFVIHFGIDDYPLRPPEVSLVSRMDGIPHVYGSWICLDMLESHYFSPRKYHGWSSGYTLMSILIQMQAFLTQNKGKVSLMTRRHNEQIQCSQCKHHLPNVCWPTNDNIDKILGKRPKLFIDEGLYVNEAFKPRTIAPNKSKKIEKKKKTMKLQYGSLQNISRDCLYTILQYLPFDQLVCLRYLNATFYRCIRDLNISAKESCFCYYTKNDYKECVLCVGIEPHLNPHNNEIAYVTSPMEYISYQAIVGNQVKKSIWNTHRFSTYMPLYIDHTHAKKSIPLFKKSVIDLYQLDHFDPIKAVNLLAMIMNTQVVNVMNGNLLASETAFIGYTQCHRWLIWVCVEYPEALKWVNQQVGSILSPNHKKKGKSSIPSIGNFLSLLSVSNFKWSSVGPYILSEQWDRNVKWAVRKNPDLYFKNCSHRYETTWHSSRVGTGLILFHHAFLRVIRKDPNLVDISTIASQYDYFLGQPPSFLVSSFINEIKKIHHIVNFRQFCFRVGCMPHKQISSILLDCYQNSLKKQYHSYVVDFEKDKKIYFSALHSNKTKRRIVIEEKEKWSPWLQSRKIKSPFEKSHDFKKTLPWYAKSRIKVDEEPIHVEPYFTFDESLYDKFEGEWQGIDKKLKKLKFKF